MTDTTLPKKRRSWLAIVAAAFVALVLLCLAVVGGGLYWVSRHIHTETTSAASAADEFERQRAAFEGQRAFITLSDQGVAQIDRAADASPAPISSLHILAYDDDDGRIVRVDIPGWLLRLSRRGRMRLSQMDGLSGVDGRIVIDDLERHGPGLVLDATARDGARVLIWAD
jgi:hypothetical protein